MEFARENSTSFSLSAQQRTILAKSSVRDFIAAMLMIGLTGDNYLDAVDANAIIFGTSVDDTIEAIMYAARKGWVLEAYGSGEPWTPIEDTLELRSYLKQKLEFLRASRTPTDEMFSYWIGNSDEGNTIAARHSLIDKLIDHDIADASLPQESFTAPLPLDNTHELSAELAIIDEIVHKNPKIQEYIFRILQQGQIDDMLAGNLYRNGNKVGLSTEEISTGIAYVIYGGLMTHGNRYNTKNIPPTSPTLRKQVKYFIDLMHKHKIYGKGDFNLWLETTPAGSRLLENEPKTLPLLAQRPARNKIFTRITRKFFPPHP